MHLEVIDGAVFVVGTPILVADVGGVHFTRVTIIRTTQQRVSSPRPVELQNSATPLFSSSTRFHLLAIPVLHKRETPVHPHKKMTLLSRAVSAYSSTSKMKSAQNPRS